MEIASTEKAGKSKEGYWAILAIAGFTLLFTLPITLTHILREPEKENICPVSESGEMVASKTIEGTLVHSGPSILLRQFDGAKYKLTHIAGCGGKGGGCDGPFQQLRNHIEESAQADYCGTSLIRMKVSGRLVYASAPPTQEFLNKANARERIKMYGCVLVLLVAIVWAVAGIRRKPKVA
ncbi:hypothetical protein [Glaciimonas soli]|uniref:Uncharacterized protein n=1 Tax=Glaciimonas soli TaxID=2590999 RepID=A0A843YRI8_9BURK|nr:hypothetical protein [Glaciimonas soli]MQR02369.1 hypothetical protein [Glaciimonas soli]